MRYILYRTRKNKKCKECLSFSLTRFKHITKIILFLNKYVDGKSSSEIYNNITNIIIHFRYNILTNNNQKYDIRIIRILYDIKQLAHKYKNCYFVSNYNPSVKNNVWILSDNKIHIEEIQSNNQQYVKTSSKPILHKKETKMKRSVSLPNIKINTYEDRKSNKYIEFLYNIYLMIINYIYSSKN